MPAEAVEPATHLASGGSTAEDRSPTAPPDVEIHRIERTLHIRSYLFYSMKSIGSRVNITLSSFHSIQLSLQNMSTMTEEL